MKQRRDVSSEWDRLDGYDREARTGGRWPGRTSLTANLPPVQAKAKSEPGGGSIPEEVRGPMEESFGVDFSSVRVHQDSTASSLGALAVTRGTDIHFAAGQYNPTSDAGRELLGHELAHVVQQSQGRVGATAQAKGMAYNEDPGLEREADDWGARAARGERVTAGSAIDMGRAAGGVAQCKIGFELQTTWLIRRIGKIAKPDSKDVAYAGVYFTIEVDAGNGRPELEIVTRPLADRKEVVAMIDELRAVVNILVVQAGIAHGSNRARFMIGPGNGWLGEVEIEFAGLNPSFRMQYTEGVTLENIPSLLEQFHPEAFNDLPPEVSGKKDGKKPVKKGDKDEDDDEDRGKDEKKAKPKEDEKASKKRKADDDAPKGKDDKAKDKDDKGDKGDKDEGKTTKLQGFLAAVHAYLGDAAVYRPERADDTLKYAFTLMARTDFYSMFHALDDDEQQQFAGMLKGKDFMGYAFDAQVFAALGDEDDEAVDLTVAQWLRSIVEGRPPKITNKQGKEVASKAKENAHKDLMSPPPSKMSHDAVDHWNASHKPNERMMKYAMGVYDLDDDDLALFEARSVGKPGGQDLDASIANMYAILEGTEERDDAFADGNKQAKQKRRLNPKEKAKQFGEKAKIKGKAGANYNPTDIQLQRLAFHGRELDWVTPDGLCILGSLAKIRNSDVETIRNLVLAAINGRAEIQTYITTYTPYTVQQVRHCVTNLETEWNGDVADVLMWVAAKALRIGVTVLRHDGASNQINGGGTLLVRVENPNAHFHATTARAL